MKKGLTWFNLTSVTLGFAFLYLPIVLLVIYSFNDSKLVTVWGGWSTRWSRASPRRSSRRCATSRCRRRRSVSPWRRCWRGSRAAR